MPEKNLTLNRGESLDAIIFPARRKELSRAELQRTLAPIITRWIKAACVWKGLFAIGDHRYVVFSIGVAPKVTVYVQFWSEPRDPVLWEVSAGRWNPPAEKWLAGERAERIQAFGFEIGGKVENFRREVEIGSASDASRAARTVVDIFYAGFDYRGLRPVRARLAYESRGDVRVAYDSFTPEDLFKVFFACGFHVEKVEDDEEVPLLRAVRRGIVTSITCVGRVPDQRLFRGVTLTTDVDPPPRHATAARRVVERATGGVVESLEMGTTLEFDGGVTIGWLVRRIQEWDEMTWSARKEARRKRKPAGHRRVPTVH